jgi:hypothetical protein
MRGATVTLTNAPAGGVEPANQVTRMQVDLRGSDQVVGEALFSVVPAGLLRFEYSTNGGGAWSTLLDLGTGYTANVLKISAAAAVPAGAKVATCLLRAFVTGNGTADPVLVRAGLMFRPL